MSSHFLIMLLPCVVGGAATEAKPSCAEGVAKGSQCARTSDTLSTMQVRAGRHKTAHASLLSEVDAKNTPKHLDQGTTVTLATSDSARVAELKRHAAALSPAAAGPAARAQGRRVSEVVGPLQGFRGTYRNNEDLPTTIAEATTWTPVNGECEKGVGILYIRNGGISEDSPLALYFTAGGQIAGLKVTIFGSHHTDWWWRHTPGDAANPNLVRRGYWKEDGAEQWSITASFRSPDKICGDATFRFEETVGDRVVINQYEGGIARAIPMTASAAEAEQYSPGSCMASMGQHYFYDLEEAPRMSWKLENLMPVAPMYQTTGASKGMLSAFLFSSPVCQKDTGHRFDNVPMFCGLTNRLMCLNWCDSACDFESERWATYHFFVSSSTDDVVCENPMGISNPFSYAFGRDCPSNTETHRQGGHHSR